MNDGASPAPTAAVVTVSDRVARGERADVSGPLAAELLQGLGFTVSDVTVVPDDQDSVAAALVALIGTGPDLLITTGGTGLSPRDVTPEATGEVLERPAPGISELIRRRASETVPNAALSRGVAGVAGRTLIVNLPGSPGGVRDAVDVLAPLLGHVVDQLHGGDH